MKNQSLQIPVETAMSMQSKSIFVQVNMDWAGSVDERSLSLPCQQFVVHKKWEGATSLRFPLQSGTCQKLQLYLSK